jgi:CBS domain-containing protein
MTHRLARQVMTENPACCTPDTPLDLVAKLMREHDCGEIPVIDPAEQPIGVVTDRDIVCRVVAEGKNPMAYPAGICMSQPVATVSMDAPLGDVVAIMEQHQVRRVPVVDQRGRCVGMISQADVALMTGKRDLAELVRTISRDTGGVSSREVTTTD